MAANVTYKTEVQIGARTDSSFSGTIGRAAKELDRMDRAASKVGKALLSVGAAAVAGAGVAIAKAEETYKGFEQEMANVSSIAKATQSEYSLLKASALEAGSKTVYTAEESAQALEKMALAGWDVNTSTQALMPVLKMAAATNKDLGTTSDLVTDSMGALGLDVKDLSGYMDMLIAANNNSNTSAEQLMQALIKTGGAARTVGADLPDTITALGILADNGTKAEESGTALNSVLTRMVSNSTALKTLDKIGVSLFDNGKFIGLKQSLQEINKAMDGFTDEEKSQTMAGIAGTRRYSLMKYLLDSVKEDAKTGKSAWDELEKTVNASAGSLDNMYATNTDTLEMAEAQLNSAKEDMQIRVTDVFANDQKEFVKWIAGEVPKATDAIVEFAEAHEGEFAEALESAGGVLEQFAEGALKAGAWVIENSTAVTGALKGIAAGILTIKTASTGMKIIDKLSNLTMGPAGILTALASAAVSAGIAIKGMVDNANEQAAADNLAEHFGNIKLSMEEIDALARQIVGEESLAGVAEVLNATSEAESSFSEATDNLDKLKKNSWKVNVGFKLDKGDYKEYGSDLESYVSSVEKYAEDKGYEVHVATTLLFGEGTSQDADTNSFFQETEEKLEKYGKELHDYLYDEVNGALADGVIDIDEDKIVQEYLQKMNSITQDISDAQNEARFDSLKLKYSGTDLDAESMKRLQDDLKKYTDDTADGAQQAYETTMSSYRARLKLDDSYTQEDFNRDSASAEKAYHDLIAKSAANAGAYMIDTINESYPELEKGLQQYEQDLADIVSKYTDTSNIDIQTDWETNPSLVLQNMDQEALNAVKEKLGEGDRKAILEYLENMKPTMGKIGEVIQWYENAGQEIPDELQNIQDTWQRINSLANPDINAASIDMGDKLSVSDGFKDFVRETGIQIDDSYVKIGEKIDDTYSKGYDIDTDVRVKLTLNPETYGFDRVQNAMTSAQNYIKDKAAEASGIDVNSELYKVVAGKTKQKEKTMPASIARNSKGGIYDKPLLTTFAEEGPEAAIPINGTNRAKDLWIQTGKMLGTIEKAEGNTKASRIVDGNRYFGSGTESRGRRLLNATANQKSNVNTAQKSRELKFVYSPNIVIKGNASEQDVKKALSISKDEIRQMIEEIEEEKGIQNGRVKFG